MGGPGKIWAWSVQPYWRLLDTTNSQTIKHTDKQSRNILDFKAALRPSSILTFNCGSICEHLLFAQYKTKQKTFAAFQIFFRAFLKFMQVKSFWIQLFEILIIHKPSLGVRLVQLFWRLLNTTNRQTIKHTDKQSINILGFRLLCAHPLF